MSQFKITVTPRDGEEWAGEPTTCDSAAGPQESGVSRGDLDPESANERDQRTFEQRLSPLSGNGRTTK